jgi:hypothetical protein
VRDKLLTKDKKMKKQIVNKMKKAMSEVYVIPSNKVIQDKKHKANKRACRGKVNY